MHGMASTWGWRSHPPGLAAALVRLRRRSDPSPTSPPAQRGAKERGRTGVRAPAWRAPDQACVPRLTRT